MRQLWLDLQADRLITDKAFDGDKRVLEPLADGKKAVIPPKANRRQSRRFDRHLIENFFAKLKRLRAIATRYDKTARHFLAAIHLAATVIRLNWRHAVVQNGRRAAKDRVRAHGLQDLDRIGVVLDGIPATAKYSRDIPFNKGV